MKNNSSNLVKVIVWGLVIALVLFVVLPTLFAIVEFALSVVASLVVAVLVIGLGFLAYQKLSKK